MLRQEEQDIHHEYYYTNFVNALKSKSTKLDYTQRLKYFMDFLHVKQYHQLVENKDKKTIENDIKSFLVYLRKDRKVSYKSSLFYLFSQLTFIYV